jgi:glycosyltransferase involved in cell wall biosynthesis
MKISVFTPFYHTGVPYIGEAYASLLAQSHDDWEWIILRNGQGAALPFDVLHDARVKVIKAQTTNGFVGALKREACGHCSGDVLFELDHDDILHSDALSAVAAEVGAGADFVYSDFAEFKDGTWDPNVYDRAYGWEWYAVQFQGHHLVAMRAPAATPQNLRRIEWAPNHLRAWRRDFYEQVGGHDYSLKFADDHDLVLRTYLAGGKIAHVAECLYFYRVHAKQNTNGNVGNRLIQELDAKVYDKYIYQLAEKFADDTPGAHPAAASWKVPRLMRLDLCGAHNCPPGYTPIDMVDGGPGSLVADLSGPWPLQDSSVGVLRACDALEHLHDPVHTMNEAWRVLAPGGFMLIMVPSTSGPGSWCDPTHVSYWNHLSWRYYTNRNFAKYLPHFKGRFQLINANTTGGAIPYECAGLIALKDGYKPMGAVLI